MKQKPLRVPPLSRIQRKNREAILEAALQIFAQHGFRGATLDQIAGAAGLSKPNLLYYFPSKEEIHRSLLTGLMQAWLEPLQALRPEGDPTEEILGYMRRKLASASEAPRESRLFAMEIMQGAAHLRSVIEGELRDLVHEKAAVLRGWMDEGRIAASDPVHLIFAIWSLTQHYADFELQVRSILGPDHDPHAEAAVFLDLLFRRLLRPGPTGASPGPSSGQA